MRETHLQVVAKDMADDLGVPFHVAKVEGMWGLYAITAPTTATKVHTFKPKEAGDGGAAHGRFSRE